MLREILTTRQASSKLKRWFTDSDMDLFIWFDDGMPVQFQLSYNKRVREHAVSWHADTGFSHNSIDTGEQFDPLRYKMSPMLVEDGEFDAITTARDFLRASENIDEYLADFIYARLLEYPCPRGTHPARVPAPKDL